ncbi:MAG: hypothetical protein JRN39_05735 [Nitrososphaerota archaeon]|nr:hypothetical protein [Nitrososphaerota archaeon]
MGANSHEELLQAGVRELQKQGSRIIRLDKRPIPDAIAIKDNFAVVVEADTHPTSAWLTEQKFIDGSEYYDELITITQPFSEPYYKAATYRGVFQLRKHGRSLREIRKIIGEEAGRKPSVATIHDWLKGKKQPLHDFSPLSNPSEHDPAQ